MFDNIIVLCEEMWLCDSKKSFSLIRGMSYFKTVNWPTLESELKEVFENYYTIKLYQI